MKAGSSTCGAKGRNAACRWPAVLRTVRPLTWISGQALPVEEHQGVEEIEEDGLVGHGSGFRWAKPSSIPCQNRTASSPSFQQRFTTGPPRPAGP